MTPSNAHAPASLYPAAQTDGFVRTLLTIGAAPAPTLLQDCFRGAQLPQGYADQHETVSAAVPARARSPARLPASFDVGRALFASQAGRAPARRRRARCAAVVAQLHEMHVDCACACVRNRPLPSPPRFAPPHAARLAAYQLCVRHPLCHARTLAWHTRGNKNEYYTILELYYYYQHSIKAKHRHGEYMIAARVRRTATAVRCARGAWE